MEMYQESKVKGVIEMIEDIEVQQSTYQTRVQEAIHIEGQILLVEESSINLKQESERQNNVFQLQKQQIEEFVQEAKLNKQKVALKTQLTEIQT